MIRPSKSMREQQRIRPDGKPFMYQTWRDLLFLHWEANPDEIQLTLPDGLFVDSFDGKAFVGLVPFFMDRIRTRWMPSLPWLSWFLEFNVRTYVHDENGTPGVWFYSLDCNQPFAVWGAQTLFSLPYFRSSMAATQTEGPEGRRTHFQSQRRGTSNAKQSTFNYRPLTSPAASVSGTLEYFLLERYILFAMTRRGLATGQVSHEPYQFCDADVTSFDTHAIELDGIGNLVDKPIGQPISAIYSPGVDVEVFPLKKPRNIQSSPTATAIL